MDWNKLVCLPLNVNQRVVVLFYVYYLVRGWPSFLLRTLKVYTFHTVNKRHTGGMMVLEIGDLCIKQTRSCYIFDVLYIIIGLLLGDSFMLCRLEVNDKLIIFNVLQ